MVAVTHTKDKIVFTTVWICHAFLIAAPGCGIPEHGKSPKRGLPFPNGISRTRPAALRARCRARHRPLWSFGAAPPKRTCFLPPPPRSGRQLHRRGDPSPAPVVCNNTPFLAPPTGPATQNPSRRRRSLMAERRCDVCGHKKDMHGGKTCEKSHFICRDCVYSGVIIISEKKHCPLDRTPLH